MTSPFLRSVRAGDHLEIFFVSAITSLLVVRFYLHLTHYPQVGGANFHIAHMLYGGLLLLIANVLFISYLGRRIERLAAIIGGIGFGVFIDELGKFITKDNNYFFQPTVALLYIIFVVMFFAFRALGREQGFTQREYLLNGLLQLDEAVVHDMDEAERSHTLSLLGRANLSDELTQELLKLVTKLKPEVPTKRSRVRRTLYAVRDWYDRVIDTDVARGLIVLFFIVDTAVIVLNISSHITFTDLDGAGYMALAQFISSLISALFVVIGIGIFPRSRYTSYTFFHRALLVTLFLTQFFAFYREQFGALGGFFINLVAFIALRYAMNEERRLVHQDDAHKLATV